MEDERITNLKLFTDGLVQFVIQILFPISFSYALGQTIWTTRMKFNWKAVASDLHKKVVYTQTQNGSLVLFKIMFTNW